MNCSKANVNSCAASNQKCFFAISGADMGQFWAELCTSEKKHGTLSQIWYIKLMEVSTLSV